MQLKRDLLIGCALLLSAPAALAQLQPQGILPGEPDPSMGPLRDSAHHGILIDDRKRCLPGFKKVLKMKCAAPDEPEPECQNYAPVFQCVRPGKEKKIVCQPPKNLVPVYRCYPGNNPADKH